jgi:hypothetical protein
LTTSQPAFGRRLHSGGIGSGILQGFQNIMVFGSN